MAAEAEKNRGRTASAKRQFAANAASGFAAQAVKVGVGFIAMPYVIWRLGPEAYGISQLAQSALAFFALLQLGMGPTLIRYCSQAIARKDEKAICEVSSSGQFILGGLGFLGMLCVIGCTPAFINFYDISPSMTFNVSGLLVCLALSLFLNFAYIIPSGLVLGNNRYDIASGIEITAQLLRLGLIVLTFETIGPSILLLGACILIVQIFRFTAFFAFAIQNVGRAALFSIKAVNRQTIKSFFGFSSLTLLNSIAGSLVIQGPALIIGKVLGLEAVTMFAPAVLIASAMRGFLTRISMPLVPLASQAQAEGNSEKMGVWSMKISGLVASLGLWIVLPLAIFGHELVGLWLGAEMSHIWIIIAIMALGAIVADAASTNFFLALGGGCIKPTVYSMVILGIVQALGVIAGTKLLSWNLLQIALFLVAIQWIRNVIYLPIAYAKQFVYSVPQFIIAVYIKPIALFFAMVGIGYTIRSLIPPNSIWLLAIEIFVVLTLYCSATWLTLLSEEIKTLFRRFHLKLSFR